VLLGGTPPRRRMVAPVDGTDRRTAAVNRACRVTHLSVSPLSCHRARHCGSSIHAPDGRPTGPSLPVLIGPRGHRVTPTRSVSTRCPLTVHPPGSRRPATISRRPAGGRAGGRQIAYAHHIISAAATTAAAGGQWEMDAQHKMRNSCAGLRLS